MLCSREVAGFALLSPSYFLTVIPAKAGIHLAGAGTAETWVPACAAGMTAADQAGTGRGYFLAMARSAFDGVSFSGWTIVLLTALRAVPRVGNSVSAPSRCRT
jgi:hypothetical protein